MENKKSKVIDFNSIKTATLVYFIVFGLLLVAFIWVLQSIFMNQFYEGLRVQESKRTAVTLSTQYHDSPEDFAKIANQTAVYSGLYVRIDSPNGVEIYDGTPSVNNNAELQDAMSRAKYKLISSSSDSFSMSITEKQYGNKYILYAMLLDGTDFPPPPTDQALSQDAVQEVLSSQTILYILAPLYPNKSTMKIIEDILMYISFIVLLISLILAVYLSHKLASPIESITKSAAELSKGNYNVKFNGGNLTETKELAKVLNQASYEMEKTEFYQKEIIANVSHDLKTPLTMIRSYAEMIQDISGDNPERRNEHLQIIISETERLNKLVSEMMNISRLQSNNIELSKSDFDLVELAREAYESFAVLNEQEGYNIEFQECKPAIVHGDKDKIAQVIHNFISNAVKYCGDDKYVKIELKRGPKKVSLHVYDHGVGIPKDEISHVWDRYYRTSANHERRIEGTGLGLSICKGILTLHNADYGVNSEEGSGSDFWFEFDIEKREKKEKKDKKDKKKDKQ